MKKTLATSVSISFAGLIRAHGATTTQGDGSTTSSGQWGSESTVDLGGMTEITLPNVTTVDPWEWFSGGPVTDETLPCSPHTWGEALPYVNQDGTLGTQRYCTKCGVPQFAGAI